LPPARSVYLGEGSAKRRIKRHQKKPRRANEVQLRDSQKQANF
jgi:hypothetical protein